MASQASPSPGQSATAEASSAELIELSSAELLERIDALVAENREARSAENGRELLRLRQLAGLVMRREAGERGERAALVEPDYTGLPEEPQIPEVTPDQLNPGLIRGAILKHGSLLVRGLADPEEATRVAAEVDRAYAARDAIDAGQPADEGYYEEVPPEPPNDPLNDRVFSRQGGGLLAPDSPKIMFEITELFRRAGVRELVAGYLGEQAAYSGEKTTLRKAMPEMPGAFHQDGKFLGDVNSLNLWISLSHCGDTAPGMDIVPLRLEEIVETPGIGDKGYASIVVLRDHVEEIAGDAGIVRPIFEPGDAMFFDHLCLHSTASEPSMPDPRFAIETWFFGPSAFPEGYFTLAI